MTFHFIYKYVGHGLCAITAAASLTTAWKCTYPGSFCNKPSL